MCSRKPLLIELGQLMDTSTWKELRYDCVVADIKSHAYAAKFITGAVLIICLDSFSKQILSF